MLTAKETAGTEGRMRGGVEDELALFPWKRGIAMWVSTSVHTQDI